MPPAPDPAPRNDSASACTRGRHCRAASAQRAKPRGISASSLARIAWPNTGAAPSVEMPITSGERLTIEPNVKSQNAGLSITFTGTPALRAIAANAAASVSSSNAPTAIAVPSRSVASIARRWIARPACAVISIISSLGSPA